MILAIDPGTEKSGWVRYEGQRVVDSDVSTNAEILDMIDAGGFDELAIEMIASYGMAVGREVFETCVWIGRFIECFRDPAAVRLIYRRDVKLHLCGSPKAKDPNIRASLIDRFGGKDKAIGRKATPGPLYGVKSHAWAALAVAVTAAEFTK